MKKTIILLLLFILFGMNFEKTYAKEQNPKNVVSEIGTITKEDLEVEGFNLVNKDINYNLSGEHILKYYNTNYDKTIYKKLILFNPDDYINGEALTVNSIEHDDIKRFSDIVDLCSYGDYTYVLLKDKLVCYLSGIKIWEYGYSNYQELKLSGIGIIEGNVLVYYSYQNNKSEERSIDIALDEIDKEGVKIRTLIVRGSLDDYSYDIQVIEKNIYLTGVTYSKDKDYQYFYPVEGSNQVFIAFVPYDEFEIYNIFGYGNRGKNELIQTIFLKDEIVLKVKFSDVGPYSNSFDKAENTALFKLDYYYGLDEVGYENYAEYGLSGEEYVIPLGDNYGILEKNQDHFSVYYTGFNQQLSGRVTTLIPECNGYEMSNYKLINYYDKFQLVIYYTNDKEKIYRVYEIINDEFLEVFKGNGEFIKQDGEYYEYNEKITEKINIECSKKITANTQKGLITKRNYYINNEKIEFSRYSPINEKYGEYAVVYYCDRENTKYFVNYEEYIKEKCSVKNGEVYDRNLLLEFNGIGYLNNKLVNSGTILDEVGRHILILESNTGDKKEYIFEIKPLSEEMIEDTKTFEKTEPEITNAEKSTIDYQVSEDGTSLEKKEEKINYYWIIPALIIGVFLSFVAFKIYDNSKKYYILIFALILILSSGRKINAETNDISLLTKKVDYEVVDASYGYEVITVDGENYLKYQDKLVQIEGDNIKIEYCNGKLYIASIIDGYLYLSIDEDADSAKRVINNKILDEYDFKIVGEYIYFYINISSFEDERIITKKENKPYLDNKCGVVIKCNLDGDINALNVFGGSKNDVIKSFDVDDIVIIVGTREKQSGGDFGNAGTKDEVSFVAVLDECLNIKGYKIINDTFEKYDSQNLEQIYIQLGNQIYQYDDELNCINKYVFSTTNLLLSNHGIIYELKSDELVKLDTRTNLKTASVIEKIDVKKIINFNGNYFINGENNYYVDVLDCEEVIYDNIYNPNSELNFDGFTLKSKITPKIECGLYFDPMISGSYPYTYTYEVSGFSDSTHEGMLRVLDEINVVDGRIYPIGYKLIFKGIARLNEEIIVNNHTLRNPGDYTLIIENVNKETKEIKFKVSTEQISFTEEEMISNNYYYNGDNVFCSFDINLPKEIKIDQVVVDDQKHKDFSYKKDELVRLNVAFNNYAKGTHTKLINGFYYYLDDEYFYYPINEYYTFTIIGKEINVELDLVIKNELDDTITLEYTINDYDGLSRNLLIQKDNESSSNVTVAPLGTTKINNLNKESFKELSINLIVNENHQNRYIKLCNIICEEVLDEELICDTLLEKLDNGKMKLTIKLNKAVSQNVDMIKVNDNVKYVKEAVNSKESLIVAAIAFVLSFGASFVFFKYKL